MDTKKEVKEFINYMCYLIEYMYKNDKYTGFSYELHNDKLAYLMNDKGIEKRIQKELYKRLKMNSRVVYSLSQSPRDCLYGELKVRLYEDMILASDLYAISNDGKKKSLEDLIKEVRLIIN